MNRRFGVIILSFLMTVLAGAVSAPASTVIKFTSTTNDQVYDGFYAGIYGGTITTNYGTTGAKTVSASFVCDDFLSEITYGQSWYANDHSNNLTLDPLTVDPTTHADAGVRYAPTSKYNGDPYVISNPDVGAGLSQQGEYNAISWLVWNIFNGPSKDWGIYGGAIWSIADGGWKGTCKIGTKVYNDNCSYLQDDDGDYDGTTTQNLVALALTHVNDTSHHYTVWTPDELGYKCNQPGHPSCNGQEFWGPYQPASEPTVAFLLGATFLGVGLLGKRVFGASRV